MTEDRLIYYCVSAKLDMTYFPHRKEGDQRITSCQHQLPYSGASDAPNATRSKDQIEDD